MALNKKHDHTLERLIIQAAADIKHHNAHIGTDPAPLSEAEYAQLQRDFQELERVWDELDRQRGGLPAEEPAARAVDEDRGE